MKNDEPDDAGLAPTLRAGHSSEPPADRAVTDAHDGRYKVKEALGQGSQGNVYVAADTHLGRDVAMKVPSADASPSALARFLREARIAAQLEHPNIVPVYEIARRKDGSVFCVQKLVRAAPGQSRSLREAIVEAKSLTGRLKLLNAFVDVCHGVAYAHSRGVLHRDLKPENVVLGRFGETIVLDWGMARADTEADTKLSGAMLVADDSFATLAGAAYGTPAYMSPEQARGEVELDARTDIWSLGAMLFELLIGRPPFIGPTAVDTVALVREAPVPDARKLSRDVPRELAAIARRALMRNPKDRYASASALADDVIAWQNGHRVRVYEYGPFELIKLFVSRNKVASLVGVASLLAVLIAAGVALQKYQEARVALSSALLEKAREAERALKWDQATQLYEAALAQNESDESRWGMKLTGRRSPEAPLRLTGQPGPARALAFAPDGKTLAVGASDGAVHLWDYALRARTATVMAHQRDVTGLSFSPDGKTLVTVSEDGNARVFSTDGWKEQAVITSEATPLNAVAFSPRGDAVATVGEDGRLQVFAWPSRERKYERRAVRVGGSGVPAYAVAWALDGRQLAWGNWRGDVTLVAMNGAEGGSEKVLTGHFGAVLSLDFGQHGLLLSAGRDGTVRLWGVDTGEVWHSFEGHTQKVYAARFAPDGLMLASGGTDRTVRLWDTLKQQPNIGASFNDGEDISTVAWSRDGKTLAWAGTSGDVRLREVHRSTRFGGDGAARTYVVAPSADGKTLVVSTASGLEVWDVATGTQRTKLVSSYGGVTNDAVYAPNGQVLWTCASAAVCLSRLDGTGEPRRFAVPENVNSLAMAPDGTWLAVGCSSGLIRLIDFATGATRSDLRLHTSTVYALAVSPDGKVLASGSYDKQVRLWGADGSELKVLKGHTHGVRRVAFSPDGKTLASTSWDTTLRLWDVATGALKAVGARHEDHVFGLSWAPSGKWLATGAWDGTIRIWDPVTARELGRSVADVDRVQGLAVDPAETGIWYGGTDVHRLDFHTLQ